MKLPNRHQAVVPRAKIVDYLLSATHREGGSKAKFFARFGFSAEQWETLAEALLQHAKENDVTRQELSAFGVRYVIDGALTAPDGRTPPVRAVWFIESNEDVPRFATAYPLREKGD